LSPLTDKQEAFCLEYLKDLNATQSAIRAGYSEKTAKAQASRLLTNVDVSARVQELMTERVNRVQVDADTVLRELLRIATYDVAAVFDSAGFMKPVQDIPEEVRRAITGIEVDEIFAGQGEDRSIIGHAKKVKLGDKVKALEILGKHLGLFVQKTQVIPPPGSDGAPQPPAMKRTFAEFCAKAGYPEPYPKQVEMKDFVIHGGAKGITGPRLLLGARGIGKTEYASILGLAHEIYLDSNDTTILSTKVEKNGRRMLKAISRALVANEVVLEINNADELRVKGCTAKESNIMLVPIGSAGFRSMHPRRVLFEDPVVPGSVSEADRDEMKTVYEEAIKLTANIAIVGQPVDFRDMYAHLRKIIETMEVPHGMIPDLDHDIDIQRAAGVDEKSIQASYFLKVDPEGDASFHDINEIDDFPDKESVAFLDPAEGGDTSALGIFTDYFNGMAIQGYAWKKAWHLCIPEIKAACEQYKVHKLIFETNMFGVLPLQILRENLHDIGVSVVGKYTHSNKEARIQLAAAHSKSMHMSKKSDIEYRRQVKEYSHDAKFDDAPDTIATFMESAGLIRPPKAMKNPSDDL
jgi:phage terminase small subunit